MRYVSVEEFEELIDADELIDILSKAGLIEKEGTMHKLIKVTPDYWGNTAKSEYWPFTQDKVRWVLANYAEGRGDNEEYKFLFDGNTSEFTYERQEYREFTDPSGHYIEIVELSEEIKIILDEADDLAKNLKELFE